MGNIGPTFLAVIGSVIGLAIVAVLVSQRAQTPSVISAGGSALASIIGAAVAPVTGSGPSNFGSNALGALGVTN